MNPVYYSGTVLSKALRVLNIIVKCIWIIDKYIHSNCLHDFDSDWAKIPEEYDIRNRKHNLLILCYFTNVHWEHFPFRVFFSAPALHRGTK